VDALGRKEGNFLYPGGAPGKKKNPKLVQRIRNGKRGEGTYRDPPQQKKKKKTRFEHDVPEGHRKKKCFKNWDLRKVPKTEFFHCKKN